MRQRQDIGIDEKMYRTISAGYRRRWGVDLFGVRADGVIVLGKPVCAQSHSCGCCQVHARALSESLRWGEPSVEVCPQRRMIWAVPLMRNNLVLGSLMAIVPEDKVLSGDAGEHRIDIRLACRDLRDNAESENITNMAFLNARLSEYRIERTRAEAIHEYKRLGSLNFNELYLMEEPALLTAIRRGDKRDARARLNRLLVSIHERSQSSLDVTKSFFMELVVTLFRTAVEMGGVPESLLGNNYNNIVELANISNEEQLAPWLARMLDRIMDSIHTQSRKSSPPQLHMALEYINKHFIRPISRDDVARAAGMSSSHFSRKFKEYFKRSFSDVLNQVRVDKACEFLSRSDKGLVNIALECGFNDQSYFTKIFKKYTGITPAGYRERYEV